MPVSTRRATVDDAAAVARLISELGYPTEPNDMVTRLTGLLADSAYAPLVAEQDGQPTGFAVGLICRFVERNGLCAQLVTLVVSERCRSMGIGSALVRAIEQWATDRGAKAVVLTSATHRSDAHAFYLHRGYEQTGVRFFKTI